MDTLSTSIFTAADCSVVVLLAGISIVKVAVLPEPVGFVTVQVGWPEMVVEILLKSMAVLELTDII